MYQIPSDFWAAQGPVQSPSSSTPPEVPLWSPWDCRPSKSQGLTWLTQWIYLTKEIRWRFLVAFHGKSTYIPTPQTCSCQKEGLIEGLINHWLPLGLIKPTISEGGTLGEDRLTSHDCSRRGFEVLWSLVYATRGTWERTRFLLKGIEGWKFANWLEKRLLGEFCGTRHNEKSHIIWGWSPIEKPPSKTFSVAEVLLFHFHSSPLLRHKFIPANCNA